MASGVKNSFLGKDRSITIKFSIGVGLLILLIVVAAIAGYLSLQYVKKTDQYIRTSTRIQALIFEMDRRMEKARHTHAQFFIQYPRIGLKKAHERYAQPSIRETANAVGISSVLGPILKKSEVSPALKGSDIDLNLYLSSAKRFADTSIQAIELVTRLAVPDHGLEDRLYDEMMMLEAFLIDNRSLFDPFHEMEHFIGQHRITRERHLMQSAFNKSFELKNLILASDLSPEIKTGIQDHLTQMNRIANEILDIDVAIISKFKDFQLQEKAASDVSEKLIRLSKAEVEKSEQLILKTYRIATVISIAVTLVGLLTAAFVAYLLHIQITRRILRLTRSAETLKNGNLESIVKEGPPDELGKLEMTFNFMSRQMKKLIQNLEERVRERTLELRQTNKELQVEIRDRQAMEEQLRQSHKMEAVGTLAGGIAHEFNNILGIIIGNAELAMDDTPEWNPSLKNIKEIKRASLRAKDVVRQLLSFSRKSEQQQKPIDIAIVIKESIRLIRSSLPSSIEIHDHVPKETATILADTTQIHQVFINLCTNASHAMKNGDGVLGIYLEVVHLDHTADPRFGHLAQGDYVRLTVKDNGSGIDEDTLERIFDPYFTTKEIGQGTGMGLAVVHGIVKNHRGGIIVDSEPGKGSTFRMVFPVVTEPAQTPEDAEPKVPKMPGNESILLVDDEHAIVKAGETILNKLGYTVYGFISPVDALAAFKTSPSAYDLVISDVTMPKLSGVDLARQMRKIRPDIPIIICTGHSDLIDEDKAKSMDIDAFTMKPLTASEIAKMIRVVLNRRMIIAAN